MGRNSRDIPEVNAGSMADIAFLLLVFFLVTTTMNQNQGLSAMLPAWNEDKPPEVKFKMRNILEVLVNKDDLLLVEGEEIQVTELKEKTREFLTKIGQEGFPETIEKAVVSLKNDRGTSYSMYVSVQNELHAAYNELRNEYAKSQYNMTYDEIYEKFKDTSNPPAVRKAFKEKVTKVKNRFPKKISEAEPQK